MDFVRVYDVHAQAREKLFDWLRPLTQEQYVQSFEIREATCPTFPELEAAWRTQMPDTRATLAAITEPGRVLRQFGVEAQDVDYIRFVQQVRREEREPGT